MTEITTFEELAREEGYASSSTAEDGVSRCVFQLQGEDATTPPEPEDIEAFAAQLCGGVDNIDPEVTDYLVKTSGRVQRRLPKLHPYMTSLSAAGVSSIKGTGDQREADSLQVLNVPSVTDQFTHYTHYDFLTEFKRRPYFLVSNDDIDRKSATYTKPDGTEAEVWYAEEWKRYTTTTLIPLPDTANATAGGQMRFRTSAGTLNGAQFPGNVWVYLQNQNLEMMWFMVPYRYFFTFQGMKPYLTRFVNTVNQFPMLGYEAGQLLFLGGTPVPYMPQVVGGVDFAEIGLAQSQSLLCNVKMRWLVTTRESDDLPASEPSGNANNIMAGHNLQPSFVDRKFHYVTVEDPTNPADQTKWRASFPSFPHELLFTDPMMTQPGGPL